jgi:hypothetical protein
VLSATTGSWHAVFVVAALMNAAAAIAALTVLRPLRRRIIGCVREMSSARRSPSRRRRHTFEDAGANPLPTGRKIALWYGGHADVTLRRCAKWGGGWMPLAYPPGEEARTAFATLHR